MTLCSLMFSRTCFTSGCASISRTTRDQVPALASVRVNVCNAFALSLADPWRNSCAPGIQNGPPMFAFSPLARLRVLQAAGENPDIRCHHRHNAKYN